MNANTIIDVRSHNEFMSGHVVGSINIPVGEISSRIEDIRNMKGPVVLCCASGARSGLAEQILRGAGIACENGGSWFDVQYRLTEASL